MASTAVAANVRPISPTGQMSGNYPMPNFCGSFVRELPEQACRHFAHWENQLFKPWCGTFAVCRAKVRFPRYLGRPKPAKLSFLEKALVPIATPSMAQEVLSPRICRAMGVH